MGVGGSFDYLTGKIRRAPACMRKIGLEWLWRFIQEPKYRAKRIWNAVVIFPIKIIFIRTNNLWIRSASDSRPARRDLCTSAASGPLYTTICSPGRTAEIFCCASKTLTGKVRRRLFRGPYRVLKWADIDYSEGVYLEDGKLIQKGVDGPYIQSERLKILSGLRRAISQNRPGLLLFLRTGAIGKDARRAGGTKTGAEIRPLCLRNVNAEEINKNIKSNALHDRLRFRRMKILSWRSDPWPGFHQFRHHRRPSTAKVRRLSDVSLGQRGRWPSDGITHVIRAEEWLPSTPKHILAIPRFGWDTPTFAHLPLLLSTDKKKLSKRMGDVAVEDYIKKGYLKEAIINLSRYLAEPGRGSTQEILRWLSWSKIWPEACPQSRRGFWPEKLDWLNAQYIKSYRLMSCIRFPCPTGNRRIFFKTPVKIWNWKTISKKYYPSNRTMENLSAVGESNKFFFQDIEYNKDLLRWKIWLMKIEISLESSTIIK